MGLSPLSSAQQRIRDQTVKSVGTATFWGFIGWSLALVTGVFLLVNFALSSVINQSAVQATAFLFSVSAVFAYWKLGYEKRRLKIYNSKSADVQCAACSSPFAIEEVGRTKTLVTAIPRSSTSSSQGQTNYGSNGGSWRTYVDVTTTTWTEEMYNITIDMQCVVCRNKNTLTRSVTEQRNRRSGTERKYY
jgi:hypothetical protein